MTGARERYRSDPAFRLLVDVCRRWITEHQFTPSEIREATLLAAYIAEMENPMPVLIRGAALANELHRELLHLEAERARRQPGGER